MATVPRLPEPLTVESLRDLMRQRAYWDLKHPRSELYHHLVRRGFEMLYPGPAQYDGIGRMIDNPPRPPGAVAGQVAEANREMDRLEAMIEGAPEDRERPSGGGNAVHVQAHTRDGGKTEVTDYWRTRPEQGIGNDSAGNADNKNEPVQADTNDARPKPDNPLPSLPQIEIRDDPRGDGRLGANRTGPGGQTYPHLGVDIVAPPGTPVVSPIDGEIDRITDAYRTGPLKGQFQAITIKGDDGLEYKFLYVTPRDENGQSVVHPKGRVRAGDPIGTVQDRAGADASGKMKNHVHIEIRDQSKEIVDPMPHIKEWRKRK